jgi:hypothetical protein
VLCVVCVLTQTSRSRLWLSKFCTLTTIPIHWTAWFSGIVMTSWFTISKISKRRLTTSIVRSRFFFFFFYFFFFFAYSACLLSWLVPLFVLKIFIYDLILFTSCWQSCPHDVCAAIPRFGVW